MAEAQAVQQAGQEQRYGGIDGGYRRELESLIVQKDVSEQGPGQGGGRRLEHARHRHGGKGLPEAGPPGPSGPDGTHQEERKGVQAKPGEGGFLERLIHGHNHKGGQRWREQQGRQPFQHPQSPFVHNCEQVDSQGSVADKGICERG